MDLVDSYMSKYHTAVKNVIRTYSPPLKNLHSLHVKTVSTIMSALTIPKRGDGYMDTYVVYNRYNNQVIYQDGYEECSEVAEYYNCIAGDNSTYHVMRADYFYNGYPEGDYGSNQEALIF